MISHLFINQQCRNGGYNTKNPNPPYNLRSLDCFQKIMPCRRHIRTDYSKHRFHHAISSLTTAHRKCQKTSFYYFRFIKMEGTNNSVIMINRNSTFSFFIEVLYSA